MITLKRNEEVEIYQVELSLKVKTKQSPFIAILILASELGEIDAVSVQANLLGPLAERACNNLLERLSHQGYLQAETHGSISSYRLTELGEECAAEKAFWIGEKGVYNVFISKSNFIKQRIIRTEKVDKGESDKENRIATTPWGIRQCENEILTINKTEVRIEDIEERCFQMRPATCILEIQSTGSETTLKFVRDNQHLFQTTLDIEEAVLQEELLAVSREFDYDEENRAVLTAFNATNLSFNRKVKIAKPIFQETHFNQVELENISHIPSNKENAELWLDEMLYKNIDRYFFDDGSFDEFANELAKPILEHYNIRVPKRKALAKNFTERDDAFYQIAKLETVDYLNY